MDSSKKSKPKIQSRSSSKEPHRDLSLRRSNERKSSFSTRNASSERTKSNVDTVKKSSLVDDTKRYNSIGASVASASKTLVKSLEASIKHKSRNQTNSTKSTANSDAVSSRKRNPHSLPSDKKPKAELETSRLRSKVDISRKLSSKSELQSQISKSTAYKEVKPQESLQKTSDTERPRTSTIRKTNANVESDKTPLKDHKNSNASSSTGTQQQKSVRENTQPSMKLQMDEDADSYEEDFEDYESDFTENSSDSPKSESDSSNDKSEYNDGIVQDEDNKQSSGLILHPSIVKRQPIIVSKEREARGVQKTTSKLQSNLLRMSTRSSTFLVNTSNNILPDHQIKPTHSFINFATAMERTRMENSPSSKLWKRGKEILELITLDEISYEICEIPPMKYSVFIKSFGKSNNKQVSVQTGNFEEDEVQTDVIDLSDKWTQHPPYDDLGTGGDGIDIVVKANSNWQTHFRSHAIKLNKFLINIVPVIFNLLNEESANVTSALFTNPPSNMSFSSGCFSYKPLTLCKDSPVIFLISSPGPIPYILSIHGNLSSLPFALPIAKEKGIMCLWNLHDNEKPEFILMSNSQPTSACFAPDRHDIVVAGMVDGSLVLWDLSEPSSMHHFYDFQKYRIQTYGPSYNTAMINTEGHYSCVVSIQSVEYEKRRPDGVKTYKALKKAMDDTFHVISLEDMGIINVWVVVKIIKQDFRSFEIDLGLTPGSQMKLVWSSTVNLCNISILSQDMRIGLRTFDFRTFPQDPSHILVTTDMGKLLHITGHGRIQEPSYYSGKSGFPVEMRCICFSPHIDKQFLVGCGDGSVIMFSVEQTYPLFTFDRASISEPIICIQWSFSHPRMYCVLDNSSTIYFCNIGNNCSTPVYSYSFSESQKVLWFTLYDSRKRHMKTSNKHSSQIALAKENGEVEVHALHANYAEISDDEYQSQLEFLQNM